jgi:hypothetical protein
MRTFWHGDLQALPFQRWISFSPIWTSGATPLCRGVHGNS